MLAAGAHAQAPVQRRASTAKAAQPAGAQPVQPAAAPATTGDGAFSFVSSSQVILLQNQPAVVVVRNNTARPIAIRARVVDQEPPGISDLITMQPGADSSVTLPAAGTLSFTFTLKAPTGWKETRAGEIVVYSTEGDSPIIRRTITALPKRAMSAVPHPKPDQWYAEMYRYAACASGSDNVEGGCIKHAFIPLGSNAPTDLLARSRDQVIGVLADSSVYGEMLVYNAGLEWSPTRGSRLRLAFSPTARPGIYEGRIATGPDSSVRLKVRVTHGLSWPIVAIALGVGLAWLMQHFLTRGRAGLDTRRRIMQLGANFATADEQFRARIRSHSLQTEYSLSGDFEAVQKRFLDRLREIRADRTARLNPENTAYKTLLDDLTSTEAEVGRWPALADELARLRNAVAGLQSRPAPWLRPTLVPVEKPAILDRADVLLRGRALSLAGVESTRAQLEKASAFAERWHELNDRVVRDARQIQTVKATSCYTARTADEQDEQKVLDDAETALYQVWTILWMEEVLDPAEIDTRLDTQVEAPLAGFNSCFPIPDATETNPAVAMADGFGVLMADGREVGTPAETGSDAEVAARLAQELRRRDLFFTGLAFTVALLTGLTELYFGQAHFGAPKDYVTAVLWGFGVKTGLELIRSFSDRFSLGSGFLKKAG